MIVLRAVVSMVLGLVGCAVGSLVPWSVGRLVLGKDPDPVGAWVVGVVVLVLIFGAFWLGWEMTGLFDLFVWRG